MTVKGFFEEYGFKEKPDVRVANNASYQNSDEPVQYIKLPKPVLNFNCMILSKNAVDLCKEDRKAFQNLETSFDETYGWKAQVPDSSAKSDLNFEW